MVLKLKDLDEDQIAQSVIALQDNVVCVYKLDPDSQLVVNVHPGPNFGLVVEVRADSRTYGPDEHSRISTWLSVNCPRLRQAWQSSVLGEVPDTTPPETLKADDIAAAFTGAKTIATGLPTMDAETHLGLLKVLTSLCEVPITEWTVDRLVKQLFPNAAPGEHSKTHADLTTTTVALGSIVAALHVDRVVKQSGLEAATRDALISEAQNWLSERADFMDWLSAAGTAGVFFLKKVKADGQVVDQRQQK